MAQAELDASIAAVRHFNRFYTRQIGVLQEGLLKSPFSLTEARVMYELAQQGQATAADLGKGLGLDAGYLSRMLRGFKRRGLIDRERSETDGRQSILWLTEQGQEAFAALDTASRREIEAMLAALPATEQRRLTDAMQTIEGLLGAPPERRVPYLIRSHQPGDMGWVVHRHGVLYAEALGWDERFEGLVAGIVATFIETFDAKRERCWIAEIDGEPVGAVFLVKASEDVAKLRLLLVEPRARGLGIGSRLVEECVRFARRVGYRTITLWTNSVLLPARRIYEKAGFRLVHSQPYDGFGFPFTGETWELELR